jgi:leucyl aminopeptidase (aminopeptidase T)
VQQHQALHKFKPDAAINLSSNIDYGAIEKKMPAEYVAKSRQARAEVHKTTGSTPWNRSVYLNLPTRQEAQQIHVDYDTYQQMQWAAINADYTAIAANAHQLEALLKTAKKGRLTAPNTKLTFNLNQGPVTINDGAISPEEARSAVEADRQISLPAGELTVLADENSANGKVLVPRDWCGYSVSEGKLTNASFAFVNGKVQHFKAEAGQACFDEYDKKDPGFSQFSGLAIGLNPALKVLSDDKQDYRPGAAEGMVFILIGGNARYGGQNKIQESFAFPIEKATLEIDGKTIIKDGKMVWTSLASK